MVGFALIILAVVIWLATALDWLALVLFIVGLILLVAPGPWYGWDHYRRRRGPPPA